MIRSGQNEGFVEYSSVCVSWVLADDVGLLDCRLSMSLAPLHFGMYRQNVVLPDPLATNHNRVIPIPTYECCHTSFSFAGAYVQLSAQATRAIRASF